MERKKQHMNSILKPVITEKSMQDAAKSKFTFMVARFADKPKIRKDIEEKFGVTVLGISTTVLKGRSVRTGKKRIEAQQSPIKKAVVQLKEGQKIGLFEVGS